VADISKFINVLRRQIVSNPHELETEAARRTAEIAAAAAQIRMVRAAGAHPRSVWPLLGPLARLIARAALPSGVPRAAYRPSAACCPAAA